MLETGDARVKLRVDGAVATITLAREEKLNALDDGMFAGLHNAAAYIEADFAVRAAIITGSGKAFCAGGDIAAWSAITPEAFGMHWVRMGHRAFDALARLRVPLIAALNGHVLGGGLELAAVADYRIAEEHVKFGQPETGLGIIPGWSGTQRMTRRFGSRIVKRMALFGEVFTARQALDFGLADTLVATGESAAAAREKASSILARGPRATQVTKLLINAAEAEEREAAIEAIAGLAAAGSEELREGVAAFKDKRKPRF